MTDSPKTSPKTEKESFKNGGVRSNAGRPKGVPNRSTIDFRETVTKLLEDNAENVSIWLAEVAATNPYKALDLLTRLAEFAAPKLTRKQVDVEHSGSVLIDQITRRIVDPLTINQRLNVVESITTDHASPLKTLGDIK